NPESSASHSQLALALAASHRTTEAVAQYRNALRLKPDHLLSLNNLAWLLSTDPDAQVRNGTEAVQLAERACRLTSFQAPALAGTLAAAYAEAGKFDEAVNTAQRACELATISGQADLAAQNRKLLGLYEARKPYRDIQ